MYKRQEQTEGWDPPGELSVAGLVVKPVHPQIEAGSAPQRAEGEQRPLGDAPAALDGGALVRQAGKEGRQIDGGQLPPKKDRHGARPPL